MSYTINQLVRGFRKKKKKKKKIWFLNNKPQKKGICVSRFTETPKKPNSADRKMALIKIKVDKKHNLNPDDSLSKIGIFEWQDLSIIHAGMKYK